MSENKENLLEKLNMYNKDRINLRQIITSLSLVVILVVFWSLKLTGIGIGGDAFCGKQEHAHSEECQSKTLICTLEEAEPHTHNESCLHRELVCQLEEANGHSHEDACWVTVPDSGCVLQEEDGHIHTDQCPAEQTQPGCGIEASEGHIHEETCWIIGPGFGCEQLEADGHIHTAECMTEEMQLDCGMEPSEGHAHTDACYEIVESCQQEEHIHIESCYSDITADLETSDDWEMTLADMVWSTTTKENVILVAQSQLGYTESVLNFQVDDNGVRRGITRYGQWYGNPYGGWQTMFVSFCLNYSGAQELPVSGGPEPMRLAWEEAGYFAWAFEFAPARGNLLFLDQNSDDMADGVAIVTDVADGRIKAIAGDVEDAVAEVEYFISDSAIMGYGRIPNDVSIQNREGTKLIAQTEAYSQELFLDGNCLVVYLQDESGYYALDGYGEYVPILLGEDGGIYTETQVPELLLWQVITIDSEGGYLIENVITQMYLPQPISTFAAGDSNNNYQYARAVNYTVWLDGTNGGMMSYGDAPNLRYTVVGGTTFTLPEDWTSPSEYSYKIRGWYDVVNNRYYDPGAELVINGNTVFYADWVASNYDIGVFNAQVVNTVSTKDFVTTRMFDYGVLFNALSSRADVSFGSNSHTETWRLLTSGNSPYSGQSTLNYIFRDWDQNNDITYPNGVNNPGPHYPTDAGSVYSGLYNDRIGDLLFDPDVEVIGKEYLGTADHLFQLCTDPTDPHYGYYYYDSERNAASYNRSEQRFYVYDYLEQTTVSSTTEGAGKYSDFLPFNSPYTNTNGRNPSTYHYNGKNNEYTGVTHYMYDATNSADSQVATNFFFGMTVDIGFYLPNVPGTGGNLDVYGKEMHFKFSGDDDVWVFVDGKLVLDLGGIHGIESGDINFSTGVVTINGVRNEALSNTLRSVGAGEHTLTLYYLERGSSMSNCAVYFNLAPRFSFSIQKEDVLTKDVLNGAQFSVFTDKACTVPAQLWTSKESHDQGDSATNVFTVENGVADMWGMGSGNTYYIKETKPPDAVDYSYAHGIISVTIDKQGSASYSVDLIEENGAQISNGFTVHGFRIDEQTQRAYLVATNAPTWVKETTAVTAYKVWADGKSHNGETVAVSLTVTDPDGTVRWLQDGELSSYNNWRHTWENLPKYAKDGVTLIDYGVVEEYVSGYYSKVEQTDTLSVTTTVWQNAASLEDGGTYLIRSGSGCLATLNNGSDTGYQWISEEAAKTSPQALWTVTANGNRVKLTNGVNQTLTFYYNGGSGGYPTDFFASTGGESNESKQYFNCTPVSGGIRLYYDGADGRDYYLVSNMTDAGKFQYSNNAANALTLTPVTKVQTTTTEAIQGWGYKITNTPLERETSLTVYKGWDYGDAPNDGSHERAQVTIELYANGHSTGRTVTLSLKNGWQDTFRGLPYVDDRGQVISYTAVERWENPDWFTHYGDVTNHNADPPYYSTIVTNTYLPGVGGPELPSTGYTGRLLYTLCGAGIMLTSLVYGIVLRRKQERRME